MVELNSVEKYFLEKTLEANFNLWNALLTINGILVSAFSLLLAFAPKLNKILITTLIASCALSILLIIWNYLTVKWHYIKIGQRLNSKDLEISKEQLKEDVDKSNTKHKFILYREYISLLLIVLEIALIIFIVFSVETTT